MKEPIYRNEWKHLISPMARNVLEQRLSAVLRPDVHGEEGCYRVRSLYFDTIYNEALEEKLSGHARREKFRLRAYDGDWSMIRLEKKVKRGSKGYKESAQVTVEEVRRILQGDVDFLCQHEAPLLREFHQKHRTRLLRPKVLVDYDRRAFVYPPGNCRVTLDYNMTGSIGAGDFFKPSLAGHGGMGRTTVLEVKYDAFLPEVIRNLVQIEETSSSAHSKYVAARLSGGI